MLAILINVLYVLIVLLFVTYEYLAITKWLKNKDQKKMEVWKAKTEEEVGIFVQTGYLKAPIMPSNPLELKAFEEILEDFNPKLNEREQKARLYELADRTYRQKYEKQLFHPRWSIRMNTLHLIETFNMQSLSEQVLKFYQTRKLSDEERVQALRVLASFGFLHVVDLLKDLKQPLSHSAYFSIFKRMDNMTFDYLMENYDAFDNLIQLDTLDAIKERKAKPYTDFVEVLLLHEDKEVRIRAIKALLDLEYISQPDRLFPLVSSPHWEERMMVARFFGTYREASFLQVLDSLLEDQNWWVRNAAAASILQYENGQEHLEYLRDHHKDRFAKEMANNWLPKENVYGR